MKIKFTTTILKFAEQGEKTGWTYIEIPAAIAHQVFPNQKKSFRVKGKLDAYTFSGMALLPMGEGEFIMALKADVRKAIKKIKGDKLIVEIEHDKSEYQLDEDFAACLEEDEKATKFFLTLAKSHQNYFSKWIEAAKTQPTKAKRIIQTINALAKKMSYAEMIRAGKSEKDILK
ncbi:MAG: hypothetical protein RL708_478 [Bacteroidota bacterium]|jgi:hypothetical protein